MVRFRDLADDAAKPLDLEAEVAKLRIQVTLAEQGYAPPTPELEGGGGGSAAAAASAVGPLAGFQSPEDFTVREATLSYTNGDSYTVRTGWAGGERCAHADTCALLPSAGVRRPRELPRSHCAAATANAKPPSYL